MENLVYGHGNLLLTHHGKSTSDIMLNLVITSWKFLFHFIYYESVYIGSWQFCHAIFKKNQIVLKKLCSHDNFCSDIMANLLHTSWKI